MSIREMDLDEFRQVIGEKFQDVDYITAGVFRDWEERGKTLEAAHTLSMRYVGEGRFYAAWVAERIVCEVENESEVPLSEGVSITAVNEVLEAIVGAAVGGRAEDIHSAIRWYFSRIKRKGPVDFEEELGILSQRCRKETGR